MLIESTELKSKISNKEADIKFAPSLSDSDRAKIAILHMVERWIEEAEQVSSHDSNA